MAPVFVGAACIVIIWFDLDCHSSSLCISIPEKASVITCSEHDALNIDTCVDRLKKKREDEYQLLCDYSVKDISKRSLGKKLKVSKGIMRKE